MRRYWAGNSKIRAGLTQWQSSSLTRRQQWFNSTNRYYLRPLIWLMTFLIVLMFPEKSQSVSGPIVAYVCFTKNPYEADILSLRTDNKKAAFLCAFEVNCAKADLTIFESDNADFSHYMSKAKTECK